jgi:CheY-like chemotaxis protein
LTKQLLVFSRKQTVQPVVLELHKAAEKLQGMLAQLAGENIDLTLVPHGESSYVRADSGYIGQILMNLVVNARDAMPDGGQVIIAVDNVILDEKYAAAHPGETPGDYVKLSVSDTGTGMTDEVKARLFEAFFTTKPVGKGTGLGLATCQSIVRRCGGPYRRHQRTWRRHYFNVYFPRVEKSSHETAEANQIARAKGGSETLLIVEDEASLLVLARTVLEKRGYKVLSAINGCEGLRAVREHKETPIALVVTDVIMPLMGGKVMADELAIDYPLLKILFMSGYTDDAIAHHGVLNPGVQLLSKPYTGEALARKVRECLDAPSKGALAEPRIADQLMRGLESDCLAVAAA